MGSRGNYLLVLVLVVVPSCSGLPVVKSRTKDDDEYKYGEPRELLVLVLVVVVGLLVVKSRTKDDDEYDYGEPWELPARPRGRRRARVCWW
jgi:hypothetical protein